MKFAVRDADKYLENTMTIQHTNASSSNLRHIRSLWRDAHTFDPIAFKEAQQKVTASGGKIAGVVHAHMTGKRIYTSKGNFILPANPIVWYTSFEQYQDFRKDFDKELKHISQPILFFIASKYLLSTARLINRLNIVSPFAIYVPTNLKEPLPTFANRINSKLDPWKLLADILKDLGVRNISFMGELGIHINPAADPLMYSDSPEENAEPFAQGCVYGAGEELGKHGFEIEYVKRLIFPDAFRVY